MGTEKRARQKANRAARIQAAETTKRKEATRGTVIRFAVVLGIGVLLVVGFSLLRRDDSKRVEASGSSTTTAASVPTTEPSSTPTSSVPAGPPEPCPAADGSSTKMGAFPAPPPMCIDPAKTYTAKVSTTKGDFTIALDAKRAPQTVNNFVYLARYHYFDGVGFHRVIPDFVVQGGDPYGDGTGGPGYQFADELPASVDDYTPGSVAMANSGPNTNGSQFFIWTGPNKLPAPNYSLFGQVTEGYDTTVKAISAGGSPAGKPTDPTTITTVTITES